MRTLRHIFLLVLASLALVAGCGGDDDGGDGGSETTKPQQTQAQQGGGETVGNRGGREAANVFIACMNDVSGYKAQIAPSTVAPEAVIAENKGYEVEPVFVNSEDGAFYSFYAYFFESQAKREEATEKLNLKFGSADVPKPDVKGSAAISWVTKDARERGKSAVDRCLG